MHQSVKRGRIHGVKIYTRNGDRGKTRLYSGEPVAKDAVRVEAYGTVDEVTATIGLLRAEVGREHPWGECLLEIQRNLMNCMAHLATVPGGRKGPDVPLPVEATLAVETWIDGIEETLGAPSRHFLLPGVNRLDGLCHMIRTQLRRAERRIVALDRESPVDPSILAYINRLSDLFYALSREAVGVSGEEIWGRF